MNRYQIIARHMKLNRPMTPVEIEARIHQAGLKTNSTLQVVKDLKKMASFRFVKQKRLPVGSGSAWDFTLVADPDDPKLSFLDKI